MPPLAKEVRPMPSFVPAVPTTRTSEQRPCFPFIFRGADVGATAINEEMKLAAVRAIAELAHAEQSEVVASAYGDRSELGPEYIIPKPFDPRLIVKIVPAVAKAAIVKIVLRWRKRRWSGDVRLLISTSASTS
ncbi:hypothetical protein DMI69_25510 [Escherichia coli]|nr:hypothetical protein [Escherichia coli]